MNWRTALVCLLSSASCSLSQVRLASTLHKHHNINQGSTAQSLPDLNNKQSYLQYNQDAGNSNLERSARSLAGVNMHDDIQLNIARTRMRMDEPGFMGAVPDLRESLQANIQRTLAATRQSRSSQQFSEFQIEKLGTNTGPKLARLRVPQRQKPNRFSAFKSGSPSPRQFSTTDIKSFEIIPKKPRTQLNRLKSVKPRPQLTQFRSQVNRESSRFSNGAVRSTNRGAARFLTTPNRQTNSLSKDFVTKKLNVSKVKAIKLPRQRVSLPAVNSNPENFMVFNNKELVLPNPRPRININIPRPLEINTARNININLPVNKPNPIQDPPAPVVNFPTQPQTIPFSSVQPRQEQEAFEPRVLPQPILPQPVDLSISSESFQLEGDNGERDDIINVFDLSNIDLDRLPVSTDNFAPSAPAIFEPIPAVPNLVLPCVCS